MITGPEELPPVSSLDHSAAKAIRHSENIMKLLLGVALALTFLSLGTVGYLLNRQADTNQKVQYLLGQQTLEQQHIDARVHQDVVSICQFMRVVSSIPAPPLAKASKLGVQIIESAREAYYGHSCTPALPPPSALLLQDAAAFGVQLTR